MRFYLAVFLVSGLLFVPAANAASCPGADPCPWTQFDSFGDVGAGEFRAPLGVGEDASGNLYVVEQDEHRVQKLDPNGAALKTFGGRGSGDGDLYYPYDIAVDPAGGGVYVTDNSNYRVEKYDTSGKFVSAWGWGVSDGTNAYQVCTGGCRAGLGGGGIGQFSSAIGIATDGVNVYVADWTNKRIQKYDLAGNPAGEWTVPGGQHPDDVLVHGGDVYVSTYADTVWRFDTSGTPDSSWDGDGVTGSAGSGPGQFADPKGIAVDATGVYVADSGNNRVQKLSSSGSPVTSWGSTGSGDGQFSYPWGLLATGGSVWVTDYNHRLQKFSQAGVHQATVGSPPGIGDYYFPYDITSASSGDMYVSEQDDIQRLDKSGNSVSRWSSAGKHYGVVATATGINATGPGDRVSRFDAAGPLLDQFGSTGSALGQLRGPAGITADAVGNLYVAEAVGNRVQKFSPAGAPLASFGSAGPGDGQFYASKDVALDAAGNLYVADASNSRIQKFSPAGAFLAKWGTKGSGDGQFRWPSAVVVDREGHVFVSDAQNNRIQEFDSNGNFIARWGAPGDGPGELYYPQGLTIDADGALWVVDEDNHRIVRFCCPAAKGGPAIGGTEQAPQADPPPASGGGSGGAADTTAPHVTLGGRTSQRTRTVRRLGLALRVSADETATVALRAAVTKRTARRLGLRGTSIGRASTSLAGGGTNRIRLRLSARARRLLSGQARVRIMVRANAADPAGNRSTASFAATLR